MKISVLIVSHGTKQLLSDTLRRLEELPDDLHEVIVVDNASTDGSPEMVESEYSAVRLLALEENVGFGAANNRAAEVATGDAMLLLNSDAWPDPGSVTTLASALDSDVGLGSVAPRLVYPDGSPQFSWFPNTSIVGETLQKLRNPFEKYRWNHGAVPRLLRCMGNRGWNNAACLLVRRTAWDQVAGFDERFFLYFEDVDLALRLRRKGWRSEDLPTAGATHVKGGSAASPGPGVEYRRAQLLYYRLHRPPWEVRFIRRRLKKHLHRSGDEGVRARLREILDAETSL